MQTSSTERAPGAASTETLPPANPYGPPPGIFMDILRRLGLVGDSTTTTGGGASGTATTGTSTGTATTGTGTTGTGTTGTGTGTTGTGPTGTGTTGGGTGGASTSDTGSSGTGTSGGETSSDPGTSETTPDTGTCEQVPTFEEALAAAITAASPTEIMALATDQVSREKVFDAMMAANMHATFLGWLNGSGGAATWVPVMTDARYETFLNGCSQGLLADQASYNTVWTLYNDPSARPLSSAQLTWSRLYTSQILPAGNTSVTWPGGTSTNPDGITTFEWRTLYMPVGPAENTMKRLMVGVRPLPRGHVNIANIAFVNQSQSQWRQTAPTAGAWTNATNPDGTPKVTTLGTSYYLDVCKTVVIVCDAAGGTTNDFGMGNAAGDQAGGVGGVQGGPALTWFMNHVRHEVGHAVGASALAGVSETGNAFATTFGGWAASNAAAIKAAPYWTASGTKKLTIAGVESDVSAAAAADWLAGLIEGGAEPAGNAVTLLAGTVAEKMGAIDVAWSGQPLTGYVKAITGNGGSLSVKDSAYQFPGFTPPGPDVIIWSSRFNPQGWTKYSKGAWDACVPKMGWYCVSSPVEMFAEMYTHKYSGGALPATVNGKNPVTFFQEIEASTDTQFQTTGSAAGGAPPMNPAVTAPTTTLPRD
jgi:hypothetical protein